MRKCKTKIDSSGVLVLIMGLCLLGAVAAWIGDYIKGNVAENAENGMTMPIILQKVKTEMQTTEKR